ncbi:MAG: hypothetical protein IT368_06415 [Candidatus Hydrogenedentes bacterium]|nr:hypothetical protein [Candidatus Hydrogenedentota bacterium]
MANEFDVDIDAIIEEALRSEAFRAAPVTLQRRVEERLRIGALMEQEQARFRYSMASIAVVFVAGLVGGAAFLAFTNLQDILYYGVPGAMGTLDYYVASIMVILTSWSGDYTLSLSLLLAAGTVLLALIPLGALRRAH